MNRIKRILLLSVSVAVLVAFLAFPVSAAGRSTVVNLLDAAEFESISPDGTSVVTNYSGFTIHPGTNKIKWSPFSVGSINRIVISVMTWADLFNPQLDGNDATFTYRDPSTGFYQFEFVLNDQWWKNNMGTLTLSVDVSYNVSYEMSIVSCLGYVDNRSTVPGFNYTIDNRYFTSTGLLDNVYTQHSPSSFPAQYDYIFTPSPTWSTYQDCFLYGYVPVDKYNAGALDSVIVSFLSPNEVSFSAGLYQSPNVIDTLTFVDLGTAQPNRTVTMGSQSHQLYFHQYLIDLTDVDISSSTIYFSVSIDPLFTSDLSRDDEGVWIQFTDIQVVYPYHKEPWYSSILNWFDTQFDRIVDALGGNSGAMNDVTENMQQAAGSLDQAGEVLDSVAKPDTGDITGAVDNVLSGVDIELYGGMLGGFFDSAALSSMMITSVVLCICSYALFGKKG